VVGTLPQYALESSIANNFGVGFEHGPQTTTIFTQIVNIYGCENFQILRLGHPMGSPGGPRRPLLGTDWMYLA
jgi:hypothetical protein